MNKKALQWRYGQVPGSPEEVRQYYRTLKIIIGADGVVSEAEAAALRNELEMLGAPAEVIADIEAFDFKAALEDHIPVTIDDASARMLLYDAIRIASADELHVAERDAARVAAEYLRIEPAMARAIEALVALERQATVLRHALLAP